MNITRTTKRTALAALFFLLFLPALMLAADDGTVARTPPMGWNSWNRFACDVSDKVVRQTADALVSTGMKDAGYVYVNIDDCWQGKRDANGNIQPNEKFPDMKALADYVHSKGLKLGIYSSPGPKTCAGYEGSYKHEQQDVATYAAWGVDYLKYDWCSATEIFKNSDMPRIYTEMGDLLRKSGRPIVFSLCQYGWDGVWSWGAETGGNLWRTTGDIEPNFNSIVRIGMGQAGLERFAGPGHWNDPDMLEVGNGKLTPDENRFHMSLWALLSAPLIAGNDLSTMKPEVLEILTNREVIALDQDPLGQQASRIRQEGPITIWEKQLADGSKAVGIFNDGRTTLPATVTFSELGVSTKVKLRDLWQKKDLGVFTDQYSTQVPRHSVVLLKVSDSR
jgi:alpha-galactosidase